MYYISKKMDISGAHRLDLNYGSKCSELHGHNWEIVVFCKAAELDENGMVVDFTEVKRRIHGFLDHKFLNDLLPFNPTAENVARWVVEQIPQCYKASVQESYGNVAIYVDDAMTDGTEPI